MKKLLVTILAAMTLLVVAAPAAEAISDQNLLRNQINRVRERKGLSPVTLGSCVSGHAQEWADEMALYQDVWHSDYLQKVAWANDCKGNRWLLFGENVGADYNYDGDAVIDVFKAWMNSSTHKEVILEPYWETLGVGTADGWDGRKYVVAHFIDK